MESISQYLQKHGQATFSLLFVRNYHLYHMGKIISTSGTTTIGAPIVGWFGQVAGARVGLGLGGAAALVAAAFGAFALRKYHFGENPAAQASRAEGPQ